MFKEEQDNNENAMSRKEALVNGGLDREGGEDRSSRTS
jgi:hypothetical protein